MWVEEEKIVRSEIDVLLSINSGIWSWYCGHSIDEVVRYAMEIDEIVFVVMMVVLIVSWCLLHCSRCCYF